MLKTMQPPPPVQSSEDDWEDGDEPWMLLNDFREEQPLERMETDGQLDYGLLALSGCDAGLTVCFSPGTKQADEEDPQSWMVHLDREKLKQVWPVLTRWVETGKWPKGGTGETNVIDLPKFPK